MEEKKKSLKHLENGDTFYLKIEEEGEFKDQYLIFIKVAHPEWHDQDKYPMFRAKITKNKEIPQSKEELEQLEYIQMGTLICEDRFHITYDSIPKQEQIKEQIKTPVYPDEFGYLYLYQIRIVPCLGKKDEVVDQLRYLGNFDLKPPELEFVPLDEHKIQLTNWKLVVEDFTTYYNRYNKKQPPIFSYEVSKQARENLFICTSLMEDVIAKYRGKSKYSL